MKRADRGIVVHGVSLLREVLAGFSTRHDTPPSQAPSPIFSHSPVAVDRRLYRLRNLVERCFNKLKNARRVATRYDKTAESFLGFIDITSIRLWLRHLST